ncbi:MAG TPA: hypothetical protein VGM23_15610, partial [Armatimonadota bacterium]
APSVAIFSNMEAPRPIEEYLRGKGWQTLFIQWGQPFDKKSLRRFNVIIVPEYPIIAPDVRYNSNLGVKPDYEEQVRQLLWDFVDQGGGLLMYGGDWPINKPVANRFLAHWDVSLLNETVIDPSHRFKQATGMQFPYQYTDQFAVHPATKDVTRVFYPTRDLYGAGVNPLKLGAGCQWLAKGTADAVSRPLFMNQEYELPDETKPGTYPSTPIIAATRQAGKGRLAVYGWSAIQTLFEYGHYMVDDIYFTRGGDGKSSDGLRLLEQTLTYLAEPSQLIAKDTLAAVKGDEDAVKRLPSLACWLKADTGVRADDAGQVSAWEDQSGKGLVAAQSVATQQPVLVKDGLNGKPVIRFDGKEKTLITPPALLAPDHTIVVVTRMTAIASGTSGVPFSYADTQNQTADAELCVWSNVGKYGFRIRYPGIDTFANQDTVFEAPFKLTDPLILVQQRIAGKTVSAYRNGVWLLERPVKDDFPTANKGFRLGTHSNARQFLNGDVAEVLVFNAALSADQRQTVEGYLAKKYHISLIPEYGGYANQPVREKPKFPAPIIWSKAKIGDPDPNLHWYRGLIGARTKLTGGTGTVADYAAAARAAKLDFIAFLEDIEDISAISKETWDNFREECRKASGPDLLVLPGQIVRRGPAGDRYFRVSDFASPPPKSFLTADGKRIDNYLYEHFDSGLNTLGPFDIRNEPSPSWISRAYNSFAVTTTKGGKTDIDLTPFLYQASLQDDPKPVAVDIITAPAQVADAAKRFLNYRCCRDLDDLRNTLKNPDQ